MLRRCALAACLALGVAAADEQSMLQGEDRVDDIQFVKPRAYPDIDTLQRDGACVGFKYKITFFAVNRYDLPPHALTQRTESGGQSASGKLVQLTGKTEAAQEFEYIPQRRDPNNPQDVLQFAARTCRKGKNCKGQNQTGFDPAVGVTLTIPLRHCLDGLWKDGPRDLEITQTGNHVQATIVNGTICNKTAPNIPSPIFTGTIDGDKLTVDDLVVCEPAECAKAAGRSASQRNIHYTTWEATIDPYGEIVWGDWVQERFDYIRHSSGPNAGKLQACKKLTRTLDVNLMIRRQGGFPFGNAPP